MTLNPYVAGVSLYSYGHSYTIYPSPYTTPETGEYPERLRDQLHLGKVSFRGRSGTPLQDTISGALSPTLAPPTRQSDHRQWQPGSRGIVLLQNYANEGAGNASVSPEYLSGWTHALRTFLALTGAGSIQTWGDRTADTGSWNQLVGPKPRQRFWDDDVWFTNDADHTVSFDVTGDEVWLLTAISTAAYNVGDLDVHVGTAADPVHQSIVCAGQMEAFTSVYDDTTRAYSPAAFKITGLDAAAGCGSKTITVRTKHQGRNHFINGVIEPMPDPPHVFVAYEPPRDPRAQPGATNLANNDPAFRAAVDQVAGEFPDRMHTVDLSVGWMNPEFSSTLDVVHEFHPNDWGMQHIADAFAAAINAEITEPIAGVMTL